MKRGMNDMKRVLICTLVLLMLVCLSACAAQRPAAGAPGGAGAPQETAAGTDESAAPQEDAPQGPTDEEPAGETDLEENPEETDLEENPEETDPEEPPEEPQSEDPPQTQTVRLELQYLTTEDLLSFMQTGGAEYGEISLQVPADWTAEAGLFYSDRDGLVRKTLEPVCLLREADDALWEELDHFDFSRDYGEVEYLSVTGGVDRCGREYSLLLGRCVPDGDGEITLWYPCTCYLRDPSGRTAVLTYYFLDPEDARERADLETVIDGLRLG